MTIVTARRKVMFRNKFIRLVHNQPVDVRIKIDETNVQPNPDFKAEMKSRFGELSGFMCSVFPILSGKLTRLFRAKLEHELVQSGLLDKAEFMVQFVPQQFILRTTEGLVTNAVPSATELDAIEDFIATFVKVGAQVTNTTDGSTSIVTVVEANKLTTTALSGGTNNLFTVGDSYTVDNDNELQIDDQVMIDGKYRTILGVIPDSEGIQETVLLGD